MHSDAIAELTPTSVPTSPTGWQASLRLGFRAGPNRTVLAERARQGPLTVQRPFYPEGEVCHTYLLHPPGGVVGGDRLDLSVTAADGTHALITTPGATKYYRSAGATAHLSQRLRVADGGALEWLPQENIYFPGAEVAGSTRIELEGTARLALWEIHCLGRPTLDERFDAGRLDTRLEIRRDRRPLLLERLRVDAATLSRRGLLADRPVTGCLVMNGADRQCLAVARDALAGETDELPGTTLIDDLLIARYLGPSTERARRLFNRLWAVLRPLILHRTPSAPRIWAT